MSELTKLFGEQKEFMYQKIEQIDKRVLENAKSTANQIEKNAELFEKISKSQEIMRKEGERGRQKAKFLQGNLHDRKGVKSHTERKWLIKKEMTYFSQFFFAK